MSLTDPHPQESARAERRSFWLALLIALAPIPLALAIAWGVRKWKQGAGQPPPEPPKVHHHARNSASLRRNR